MLTMRRLILVIAIGAVCAPSLWAQERADLALSNGTIFSADGSGAVYSTIVIRDGGILALGGPELLGQYRADRVVDLQGRLVVPGFNDTSMSVGGGFPERVDLTGSRSIDEIGYWIFSRPRRLARASGSGPQDGPRGRSSRGDGRASAI